MPQSINITVAHSLTQDKAMRRVLAWLQSQDGTNPRVQSLSTVIDNFAATITLKIIAYGYPIQAVIAVTPNQVRVVTGPATDMIEGAAMWWEGLQLQKQLTEVLKP